MEGEDEGEVRTGLVMMCWDLRCPPREREREERGEEGGVGRVSLPLLLLGSLSSSLLIVVAATAEGAGRKAKGRCWGALDECSHSFITRSRMPPPAQEEEREWEGEEGDEMQRTSRKFPRAGKIGRLPVVAVRSSPPSSSPPPPSLPAGASRMETHSTQPKATPRRKQHPPSFDNRRFPPSLPPLALLLLLKEV